MLSAQQPRMYGGRHAKTTSYSIRTRKVVNPSPTVTEARPAQSRYFKKQAAIGAKVVFAFEPAPTFKCCRKKGCMSHFPEADDPRVQRARAPLYDWSLSPTQRRVELREAWRRELRFQQPDGRLVQVCLTAACRIFACSRSFLYETVRAGVTPRSNALANSARATTNVSVAAWFLLYKETLDVMPDEGWYMVPVGRKRYLFEEYMVDCDHWPLLYKKCVKNYFLEIWTTNFPDLRLRKHCRFAKCTFCVTQKELQADQTTTEADKAESRERSRLHISWALTRERGMYHRKVAKAVQEPTKVLSVALDGTDKMINGFPHFWRTTKEDAKGKRLFLHTQVGIVHGCDPYVFLAHEDVAGDPNWTIESLYQIFKREEQKRADGLPRILYLQLDNCFRENKNTYLFAWLSWLVERSVFDQVFISFLPTGHTHFDPDQFASRIAVALKFRNVKTVEEYIDAIRQCWGSPVTVEWIHEVMDIKELFNPGKDPNFAVGTAIVRQLRGIGTKTIQPYRKEFMDETSPLHWRVKKDLNGKAIVQSKFTIDDLSWSAGHQMFDTFAPRPGGRVFAEYTSGVLPSDVVMAPNRPCSDARAKELREALNKARARLSETEWEKIEQIFTRVTTNTTSPRPVGHGRFVQDDNVEDAAHADIEEEEDMASQAMLYARHTAVFLNQSHQQRARDQRAALGYACKPLVVNNFVAYTTNYASTVARTDQNDFWVGKIVQLDVEQGQVQLQRWHTGTKKNLTSTQAKYQVWTGDAIRVEWIETKRVLDTFDKLTKGRQLDAPTRRTIGDTLTLLIQHQQDLAAGREPDLAVGADETENPLPK